MARHRGSHTPTIGAAAGGYALHSDLKILQVIYRSVSHSTKRSTPHARTNCGEQAPLTAVQARVAGCPCSAALRCCCVLGPINLQNATRVAACRPHLSRNYEQLR